MVQSTMMNVFLKNLDSNRDVLYTRSLTFESLEINFDVFMSDI